MAPLKTKFQKNFCKSTYFATGISMVLTETQSIGIHDVYLFDTELAMHCRVIFKYGYLFSESRETFLPCVAHISHDTCKCKTRLEQLLFSGLFSV